LAVWFVCFFGVFAYSEVTTLGDSDWISFFLTGLLAQEDQFELLERVGVGAYGLRHDV
jgi:hypothetical protein